MEKFIIKQGWFRSAGIKYNWVKDGFDVRGVGLAKHVLGGKENIVVEAHIVTGKQIGRAHV